MVKQKLKEAAAGGEDTSIVAENSLDGRGGGVITR
jgi:hypothetical protein